LQKIFCGRGGDAWECNILIFQNIEKAQSYNPQNHTLLSQITVLQNLKGETNSFVIRDKKNDSLVLVDPVIEDAKEYSKLVEDFGAPIETILFFNINGRELDFIETLYSTEFKNFITEDVKIIGVDHNSTGFAKVEHCLAEPGTPDALRQIYDHIHSDKI
jgi:hypothetical protein